MGELTRACGLANRLLDEPNCDPDDDLRVLARQLLRRQELVQRLQDTLTAQHDPTRDMIEANRDAILRMHEEAVRRVRKVLEQSRRDLAVMSAIDKALAILDALRCFHPMHGESFQGWPE